MKAKPQAALQKSTESLINDMRTVSQGLFAASEARAKYSASWQKLGESLLHLVESETPEFVDGFNQINEQFKLIAEIHLTLSNEENRSADDFRDIIERFMVIYRENRRYQECKLLYAKSDELLTNAINRNQIESTKPSYAKNKERLEMAVETAKADKRTALDNFKQSIRDLIEYRKKYDAFKIRKLVSGWTRYGNALKTASESELEAFKAIQIILMEMKNASKNGKAFAQKIETAIENHMNENNPPPEIEPISDDYQIQENIVNQPVDDDFPPDPIPE